MSIVKNPLISEITLGTPNLWSLSWEVEGVNMFSLIRGGKVDLESLATMFLGLTRRAGYDAQEVSGSPELTAEVVEAVEADERLNLAIPVAVIDFVRVQVADGEIPTLFTIQYKSTGELSWVAGTESGVIQAGA